MTDETTTNGASNAEAPPAPFAEAVTASAEAETAEPREERSKPYQDRFLVPMTDEDRAAMLADLGALASDIDVEEAAAKAIAKEHRDSLDDKHKKLRELIRSGREGKIEKHLKVVDVRILSLNVLRIVRVDNGEVVFERPLAAGERQGDLFPPKKDDAKTSETIADNPPIITSGAASPLETEPTVETVGVDPAAGPDETAIATIGENGVVEKVDNVVPIDKPKKKGSRKKKG